MANKRSNQAGFSLVEALLVIIALALIIFVGYYVWHTQKRSSDSLNAANAANQSTLPKTVKKDTTATPQPKYLTIKEWGVKIPLSSADSGTYYKVDANTQPSSYANPEQLDIYASQADDLTGPNGISCKGESIAYLMRLPKDDSRWQPSNDALSDNVSPLFSERQDVGNYRYAVATHKQYGPMCFTKTTANGTTEQDSVTMQKFADVVNAFQADFKHITAE